MFDSIRWIASGLNIFNLREPAHFRFLSLHGFVIYLLSYILVVSYDPLFNKECLSTVTTSWQETMKVCNLGPEVIIIPFFYMAGAFLVIRLIKKENWSADAVFNNLSLLIVIEAVTTALLYQNRLTVLIMNYTISYFVALSVTVVVVLGGLSLLAERYSQLPKWTCTIELRASPGIVHLLAAYVVLSAVFYCLSFGITYGLSMPF